MQNSSIKIFTKSKNKQTEYDIYIGNELEAPIAYSELCYTLTKLVTLHDTVTIHLNTLGGILDSAIQICAAMDSCPVPIHIHTSGSVHSSGTLIMLHGNTIQIDEGTSFLFHKFFQDVEPSEKDLYNQINFMNNQLTQFFKNTYLPFLTNQELNSMLNGNPIWMTKQQVLDRWA